EFLINQLAEKFLVGVGLPVGEQRIDALAVQPGFQSLVVGYRFMKRFFYPEQLNARNALHIGDELVYGETVVSIYQNLAIRECFGDLFGNFYVPLKTLVEGHPAIAPSYFQLELAIAELVIVCTFFYYLVDSSRGMGRFQIVKINHSTVTVEKKRLLFSKHGVYRFADNYTCEVVQRSIKRHKRSV